MSMISHPSSRLMVSVFLLLCLIWGTTWAAIKIGLEGVPPFTGAALRFALAAAILFALGLARGIRFGRSRVERRLWVVNGLMGFAVSYGVVYWAEQWIPSGLASVLFATYPLMVAILGHFILPEERIGLVEAFAILVGFGGVGVIFSEDLTALGGQRVALGAAVMLLSPIAAAVSSVSIKRWGGGIDPASLSAPPMTIAAALLGSAAWGFERERAVVWDGAAVGALLYLAVMGSVVTFSLYYWLLARIPAKRMALIAYLIPVVAVIIGTLRGEQLTPRVLTGAALVIGAVALATRPHPAPRFEPDADA